MTADPARLTNTLLLERLTACRTADIARAHSADSLCAALAEAIAGARLTFTPRLLVTLIHEGAGERLLTRKDLDAATVALIERIVVFLAQKYWSGRVGWSRAINALPALAQRGTLCPGTALWDLLVAHLNDPPPSGPSAQRALVASPAAPPHLLDALARAVPIGADIDLPVLEQVLAHPSTPLSALRHGLEVAAHCWRRPRPAPFGSTRIPRFRVQGFLLIADRPDALGDPEIAAMIGLEAMIAQSHLGGLVPPLSPASFAAGFRKLAERSHEDAAVALLSASPAQRAALVPDDLASLFTSSDADIRCAALRGLADVGTTDVAWIAVSSLAPIAAVDASIDVPVPGGGAQATRHDSQVEDNPAF